MEQRTGVAATVSILLAIGSYVSTCVGRPILGLILAFCAIPLGGLGMAMAASPRVSGGILSITAIVLGIVGIAVAVIGMVFNIAF